MSAVLVGQWYVIDESQCHRWTSWELSGHLWVVSFDFKIQHAMYPVKNVKSVIEYTLRSECMCRYQGSGE